MVGATSGNLYSGKRVLVAHQPKIAHFCSNFGFLFREGGSGGRRGTGDAESAINSQIRIFAFLCISGVARKWLKGAFVDRRITSTMSVFSVTSLSTTPALGTRLASHRVGSPLSLQHGRGRLHWTHPLARYMLPSSEGQSPPGCTEPSV